MLIIWRDAPLTKWGLFWARVGTVCILIGFTALALVAVIVVGGAIVTAL